MTKLVKHQITYDDGGTGVFQFFFLAPAGHYTGDIGNACGVEELPLTSDFVDMPITKVEELILSPVASRKVLRCTDNANKNKYVDVIIASNKLAGADAALTGKNYKTYGTIRRVMDSRKAFKY